MLPATVTISSVAIETIGPRDEERVVATLTKAFLSDPAARWLYSDEREYWAYFPGFVRAFGGRAFAHDSAYATEGFTGAALWLPPGVEPDEAELGMLLERTAHARIRADVFAILEQMGSYHPREPHWYLPLIGVEGPLQGRGCGSALLRHALAICDRDGLPAYLESSNPRNIPLYERHGFEVIGTIQAGSSPEIFPMVRPAA